ncbi:UBX domain-containing protein 6 isoform X2 [Tachysurus fulvidraco]|uniref:UBX domain-containing protein 6 isoform X2 n=1 Tax=Tachysurus fulvidraco TaxID=1234273 RepID=UPI001FF059C0|nr:UBX domain-containing protein 6 isoform X2 [Tachysurus fulvidraco]
MKKFFEDIKKDVKFKTAGPGKKLTDDTSKAPVGQIVKQAKPRSAPNESAQRAGAAALARIEQQHKPGPYTSQDTIRNQVKRELEAEAAATAVEQKSTDLEGSRVSENEAACFSVSGVYFICPLTGETLKKSERETHIKEAILLKFSENPVEASVMMVHTFNKDREKVKGAVDIISKYIENICKNPTEEKYRRIKVSNKVFQEKVSVIEGSREFLQALGFESTMLPVDGQENTEEFLVLAEQDAAALEQLKVKKEQLQNGEPIRAKLDRQAKAFRPSQHAMHFELPPDFYNLTAEELKREQQLKSDLIERNSMLRTKAMREKDEQRERKKYNYALIRVRLPDGNILQGTFWAWDKAAVLYQFVRDSLEDGWQPFELVAPGSQKLKDDEELALNECNLVPAALLTFSWDSAVQEDIAAAGGQSSSLLKPELLKNLHTLS